MAGVLRYVDLAREILGRPAAAGRSRLVAVDGPSGSGKSFFAERLARGVHECGSRAALVHTDDLLEGWSEQLTFWPRLEEWVLRPLRRGEAGGFPPYDWVAGRRGDGWVTVPPEPVVVLEGFSSSRRLVRGELSFAAFVTAPAPVCVARAAARDGGDLLPFMDDWRACEREFFAEDRTRESADLVVDGAPQSTGHDPEREFLAG